MRVLREIGRVRESAEGEKAKLTEREKERAKSQKYTKLAMPTEPQYTIQLGDFSIIQYMEDQIASTLAHALSYF